MELKKAKYILSENVFENHNDSFSSDLLHSHGWYLCARAIDSEATLDGAFTADELEAIATWMRNPKECFEAQCHWYNFKLKLSMRLAGRLWIDG